MLQKIKKYASGLSLLISPTTTDKNQFEHNIRNSFMLDNLLKMVETIERHFGYIGKEVNGYINNPSVITKEEYEWNCKKDSTFGVFNKINPECFIYSNEDFLAFQMYYIQYQIDYFSKDLIDKSVYQNSTNPFSNLEFQWIVESKQQLIKFYKQILRS